MNLKTKFAGLELRSPIIAGSCGLTAELSRIQEIAGHGAGAIILKSVLKSRLIRKLPGVLMIVIRKKPIIFRIM